MNSLRERAIARVCVIATVLVAAAATSAQTIELSKERSGSRDALPFAAPPAKVPAPIAPAKPAFVLATDQPIHDGLRTWARSQDWDLRWYPAMSWRVLREADFSNAPDAVAAVSEVIDILRDEGKPVRLRVSEGNRVMEVLSTEVTQ